MPLNDTIATRDRSRSVLERPTMRRLVNDSVDRKEKERKKKTKKCEHINVIPFWILFLAQLNKSREIWNTFNFVSNELIRWITYTRLSLSSLDEISTVLHFISHYTNSPARWLSFFRWQTSGELISTMPIDFRPNVLFYFHISRLPSVVCAYKKLKKIPVSTCRFYDPHVNNDYPATLWLSMVVARHCQFLGQMRRCAIRFRFANISDIVRQDEDSHGVNLARKYCWATTNGYVGHEPVVSQGMDRVINTTECARGTTRLVININGASIGVITIK